MMLESMPNLTHLGRPIPEFLMLWEPAIPLWWRANHSNVSRRVTGGLAEVRSLLASIDGRSWPWTALTGSPEHNTPWAQALGSPGALVVEISTLRGPRIVYSRDVPKGEAQALPPECRDWVESAFSDELHDVDGAMRIALRHLLDVPLDGRYGLRPVRKHEHRRY